MPDLEHDDVWDKLVPVCDAESVIEELMDQEGEIENDADEEKLLVNVELRVKESVSLDEKDDDGDIDGVNEDE